MASCIFCAKPVPGDEMDSPRRGQIFTPEFQDLLGWLFKIPVRMVATSCLVAAAKFFDRLSNLLGFRGLRDELEICLELVCGAAVFAVFPIDSA